MSTIDWVVLFGTLILIVSYGVYKSRGSKDINSYLKGENSMKWWTIGLSIMATQASAITFLSTPGQAYQDGMGFIQFYFGLPIAMVIISIWILPIYYKLKIYTAYEYLEGRFNLQTRILGAFLFLIQRGLAAGITIYAPAIILSSILGWPLFYTNLVIGVLVIIYTVSGGTKAVSQTQKHQMIVMMGGMIVAGIFVVKLLPDHIGFVEATNLAGHLGKLDLINTDVDFDNRYTLWTGLLGGLFVALSYFGTDQSQVARYLSGKTLTESRLGLMFNGLLKIPMQFIILFIGAMVFVFYQFNQPPVFFNEAALELVHADPVNSDKYESIETAYSDLFIQKKEKMELLAISDQDHEIDQLKTEIKTIQGKEEVLRDEAKAVIKSANPNIETTDTDYVFISFVMKYLPAGIIGLLLAVIFSAAMSSTASELNALASTTIIDIYKRNIKKDGSERHYLIASKLFTLFWGLVAVFFATFAGLLDNLIQAVNILGSIFYGTILGIFLVGFFLKWIKGNAVFVAALIAQAIVLYFYFYTDLAYLWFNVIGCGAVMAISGFIQLVKNQN
ncbi:sodium:solute symporter [Marivirga sp. S37H4]|uniref:Sodium:solute symporter n=1 Tax=Marivirga aurantiaca TaxID=2802615 RepID=A0A935C6J9_9BACT|nr:sodium:solute symporter [Marivirga aurantiaca]MBK6264414.1 sodium:solute symporter [Marivirga aurantiaca]